MANTTGDDTAACAAGGQGTVAEAQRLLRALGVGLWGAEGESQALAGSSFDARRDLQVALLFAAALFAVNWAIRVVVAVPMRAKFGGSVKVHKFAQSASEVTFYGVFSVLGAVLVPRQPWSWPSLSWFAGLDTNDHDVVRDDLRCYYMLYGARYLQMVLTLLLEPRRKDFVEMMLHHVVTTAAVSTSLALCYTRCGCIVMFLLDPADVPLHCAKMCKYIEEAKTPRTAVWLFVASRLFEAFAVSFVVTRVFMFGYVTWAIAAEGGAMYPAYDVPEVLVLSMMQCLWLLQVYWAVLIAKVAVRLAAEGNAGDVRSDDEDDDAGSNGGAARKRGKPAARNDSSYWALAFVVPVLVCMHCQAFFIGNMRSAPALWQRIAAAAAPSVAASSA